MTMQTLRDRFEALRDRHRTRKILGMTRLDFRRWLDSREGMEAVREIMAQADENRTAHLRRDFREWTRATRSSPQGVGSGRSAFWHAGSYQRYALICRLLHERLGRGLGSRAMRRQRWAGWTGERVRKVARLLADIGHHGTPEPLPSREVLAMALLPAGHYDEVELGRELRGEATPQAVQWKIWMERVVKPAWGRYVLDAHVEELRRDPAARTSSMVVGEIRRLRGAPDAHDMRHCSGCEYLGALAQVPELHDWLLSRAGQCTPMRVGDLEAVLVPFGLDYPAEFDYVFQLGLSYEVRVRRAEWDALRIEQRTAAVVYLRSDGLV